MRERTAEKHHKRVCVCSTLYIVIYDSDDSNTSTANVKASGAFYSFPHNFLISLSSLNIILTNKPLIYNLLSVC